MEGFSDQQGELVRVDDEAEAAGTGVFVLIGAPSYGPSGTLESFGYRIGMVGEVVGHSEDKPVNRIRPTKYAAIAAAQELIDLNPGYEIIDLTDRPAEATGQDRWPGGFYYARLLAARRGPRPDVVLMGVRGSAHDPVAAGLLTGGCRRP